MHTSNIPPYLHSYDLSCIGFVFSFFFIFFFHLVLPDSIVLFFIRFAVFFFLKLMSIAIADLHSQMLTTPHSYFYTLFRWHLLCCNLLLWLILQLQLQLLLISVILYAVLYPSFCIIALCGQD